jgi:hypothetical protein
MYTPITHCFHAARKRAKGFTVLICTVRLISYRMYVSADPRYTKMASDTAGLMDRVAACVEGIPELDLLVKPDAAITPIVAAPGSGINIYK